MLNNVNLVEEDEGVEHRESGVVENACQNYILQTLEPVRLVDLSADRFIINRNNFLVPVLVSEPLAMVCLVGGKIWVVFQRPDDTQYTLIRDSVLNDGCVIQQ